MSDYREKMRQRDEDRPRLNKTLGFRVPSTLLERLESYRQHVTQQSSGRLSRVGVGEVTRSLLQAGLDSGSKYRSDLVDGPMIRTLGGFRVSAELLDALHSFRHCAADETGGPVSIGDVARCFIHLELEKEGF